MISVIIPIHNESQLISQLFERTIGTLESTETDFEVICVDDGSTDNSLELLLDFHKTEPRFKVLSLSRKFGTQAAYTAGLSHAKGDYIAMMDGDLQDPPEVLQNMYNTLRDTNYNMIFGKRKSRMESFTTRLLARIFHFTFKTVSGLPQSGNVGNFGMMDRKSLNALLNLNEKSRYIPGLRFFIGFKQGFVEYDRDERDGQPRMSFYGLIKLALDAIFSFSDWPIKVCFLTGIMGSVIFLLAGLYILISKVAGIAPFGWSSLMVSIFFLGSIQLIFLGIIGEYVFRVYKEAQDRPVYIIDEYHE